jgi:hypothetical protein
VRRTDLDGRCSAAHWGFFMPRWFDDPPTPAVPPPDFGCVSPAPMRGDQSVEGAADSLGTAYCCPGERSASPPHAAGAPSCEQAVEDAAGRVPVVLAAEADGAPFAHILSRGSYFEHCGAPNEMGIDMCVAVVEGEAIGVTVRTRPASVEHAECVAEGILRLNFPSSPRMDVARIKY